jgi:tRNA A-37 threonylcarbamoyl transferase component Bud32
VSQDREELALDETLLGDTAPDEPVVDVAWLTPGGGSTQAAGPPDRHVVAAHAGLLVLAAAAAANLVYFIVRFALSGDAPALHPAFYASVASADPGRFGPVLSALGGAETTMVRLIVVSTILLLVPVVIAWRNSRVLMVQVVAAVTLLGGQMSLAVTVLTSSEPFVLGRVVALVLYLALTALAMTTLVLYPSGKPVPRWALGVLPLAWAPSALQAIHMYRTRDFSRPLAIAAVIMGLLFVGFLWHRYRRHATLRQRHQIKWLAYGGATFLTLQLLAIGLVLPLLTDSEGGAHPLHKVLYEVLLGGAYLIGVIIALLSAVRYRLWEIDRLINRTVVYAGLSVVLVAFLAIAYFALRLALYEVLAAPGGVAAVASLAVVLAAFSPCRRRITRWVDRRFYGIRIDYQALADRVVRGSLPATGPTFASYDELVLLGRGGMGAVYRAHHPDFDVPVALKVMSPELADDGEAQARFRREAHILEGVRHPNVVPFLASGHDHGLAFIAMRYFEGADLRAILRQRTRLAPAETIALLGGVASALDATHALGIVHRDVKPANILVEGAETTPLEQRRPRLMDFGVAKWSEAEPPGVDQEALIGSLHYIAPEQIQTPAEVDGRADVYSLGATAFELLTGRPPFLHSSALGLVMAHLNQPPPDPRAFVPDLPDRVAAAIVRALAKDPDDRFDSATALVAAMTAPAAG